ncbi:hypothetical protein PISMIDRAFT_687770 [Pisolithus microcarpus 441]|uniref:Uncharacterized protein n=1 Tax=Pisolithus microcarpus 441 TaxID=765257 RepID=A0A0C9XQW2_9AGAM|nr:hypothetical protein PISMIDRAFT_690411 [Pisolithus microcarpus 441]KIK14670.1 hypothetical protein PISMIDRAFT_687770 [Pisolithus microcarpus 441]
MANNDQMPTEIPKPCRARLEGISTCTIFLPNALAPSRCGYNAVATGHILQPLNKPFRFSS